jgi:hypothetical protein
MPSSLFSLFRKRRPKKESASDDRRLNETIAEFLER